MNKIFRNILSALNTFKIFNPEIVSSTIDMNFPLFILHLSDFLLKDFPTIEITKPHNGIKMTTKTLSLGLIMNIEINVNNIIIGSLTSAKIDKMNYQVLEHLMIFLPQYPLYFFHYKQGKH